MWTCRVWIVGLLGLVGCGATGHRVHHVGATTARFTAPVVYYALPQTVIVVSIPVFEKTIAEPRCTLETTSKQLDEYDAKLDESTAKAAVTARLKALGIDATKPCVAGKVFGVGKPTFATREEADPAQVYAIEVTDSFFESNEHAVELSDRGLLVSGKLESTNQVYDLVVKGIGAGLTVAKALITKAAAPAAAGAAKPPPLPPPKPECVQLLEALEDTVSQRRELLSHAEAEKDTLELLRAELAKEEAGLRAAFESTVVATKEGTAVCEVTPASSQTMPVELLRWSGKGFSAGASCVVPAELGRDANPSTAACTARVEGAWCAQLVVTPKEDQMPKLVATSLPQQTEPAGIAYRIPAQGELRFQVNGVDRAVTRVGIAQYGQVARLPGDTDSDAPKAGVTFKLDPKLGSLVSFSTTSGGADTGAVTTTAEGAAGLIAARKSAQASEEAEPIEALEREKKRLELERDIAKLRAEQAPKEPEEP